MAYWKNFLLIVSIAMGVDGTPARAEVTCYDSRELTSNKANLPSILQNFPIYLSMSTFAAKGVIKLIMDDGKLKTGFNIKSIRGNYKDESYVSRICKDGEDLKFYLENTDVEIKIKQSGEKLSLQGQELKKCELQDFDRISSGVDASRKPIRPQSRGMVGSH